jgi:2-polyprenyl-3-methyl-5-hydroxy-6-metoxy-1,4-benzoquinol methylase
LRFFCSIARQCFINEFVFSLTDSELERATGLRDEIAAAAATGESIEPLKLVAVASYFPLHSLPGSASLLERSWAEPVAAVLAQQVREPHTEEQIRDSMPRLTTINDSVSRAVQTQYEENPYPRWVRIPPVISYAARGDETSGATLPADVERFFKSGVSDILVAGCGTGQQAIEAAQADPASRVLAVDLSLASLAYAKRMTDSGGFNNVEYAQADILELGALGRTFDAILAAGVLHHMADPFAGWRILRSLLRPRGIMDIALYSELGRRDIVAAQQLARDRAYRPVPVDIRRLRDDVMAQEGGAVFRALSSLGDFFTTSECRDALFHVQEHRLTLPEIAKFLAANNLKFLGFRLDPRLRQRYLARFPQDAALTDLTSWHQFETENPDTFSAMYQFLVQDAG